MVNILDIVIVKWNLQMLARGIYFCFFKIGTFIFIFTTVTGMFLHLLGGCNPRDGAHRVILLNDTWLHGEAQPSPGLYADIEPQPSPMHGEINDVLEHSSSVLINEHLAEKI